MQVYTGNFQGTGVECKHGVKYPKHVSVCLESQKYPDSPNKKDWPSAYLKPGKKYYSHVAYKFSVKSENKRKVKFFFNRITVKYHELEYK